MFGKGKNKYPVRDSAQTGRAIGPIAMIGEGLEKAGGRMAAAADEQDRRAMITSRWEADQARQFRESEIARAAARPAEIKEEVRQEKLDMLANVGKAMDARYGSLPTAEDTLNAHQRRLDERNGTAPVESTVSPDTLLANLASMRESGWPEDLLMKTAVENGVADQYAQQHGLSPDGPDPVATQPEAQLPHIQ